MGLGQTQAGSPPPGRSVRDLGAGAAAAGSLPGAAPRLPRLPARLAGGTGVVGRG